MIANMFAGQIPVGIVLLLALTVIVISFVGAVKRFHDFNWSGGFAFLIFLPFVQLLIGFIPGTKGPNRFGEDPLGDLCPACKEYINSGATRCHHCGIDLNNNSNDSLEK